MKSRSNTHTRAALFDVSSGAISGAHVFFEATATNPKATLFSQTEVTTPTLTEKDVALFVEQHTKLLGQAAQNLTKTSAVHIDHIQVVLSSPWFASQTRRVLYKKNAPFVCTKKLIDSLIEKEVEYIMKHDMTQFGVSEQEGVLIEKQLSNITLNGYTTHDPYGKKASSLELFLVVTVCPKLIIDRFTSELLKVYGRKTKLSFTTGPYATAVVARDYLHSGDDIIVVDIGETITDVAFIKKGTFLYNYSFPSGIFLLYQTLVTTGESVQTGEARALIEALSQGKLHKEETVRVQTSLRAFGDAWKTSFEQSLQGEHYGFLFPHNVYITVDARFSLFFTEVLSHASYLQHMSAAHSITPLALTEKLCAQYIASADGQPIHTPLIVAALFTMRRLEIH